jgi:hypothetical protein
MTKSGFTGAAGLTALKVPSLSTSSFAAASVGRAWPLTIVKESSSKQKVPSANLAMIKRKKRLPQEC